MAYTQLKGIFRNKEQSPYLNIFNKVWRVLYFYLRKTYGLSLKKANILPFITAKYSLQDQTPFPRFVLQGEKGV